MSKREELEYTPFHQDDIRDHRNYLRDLQAFRELAVGPEQNIRYELIETAMEQLSDSAQAIGEVHGHDHYSLMDIQTQLVVDCRNELEKALRADDFEQFAATAAAAEETGLRFAGTVRENTGSGGFRLIWMTAKSSAQFGVGSVTAPSGFETLPTIWWRN